MLPLPINSVPRNKRRRPARKGQIPPLVALDHAPGRKTWSAFTKGVDKGGEGGEAKDIAAMPSPLVNGKNIVP